MLALGIAITLLVARVGLPLGTIAGAVFLVAVWLALRWQLSAKGQYLSPRLPDRRDDGVARRGDAGADHPGAAGARIGPGARRTWPSG